MAAGFFATPFATFRTCLALALSCAVPAIAADALPLTAAQKNNLGIVSVAATTQSAAPALTYPARVTLPPASVRVIAAAGAGLVTQLHVQADESVRWQLAQRCAVPLFPGCSVR